MSTKQLRLSDQSQMRNRAKDFLGNTVSLVLLNGNVFIGILSKVSDNEVCLINMRNKKMLIPFDHISELYFDTVA